MSTEQDYARLLVAARKVKDILETYKVSPPAGHWWVHEPLKELTEALSVFPLAMQGCRGFVAVGHVARRCGRCNQPAWEHEGLRSTRQPAGPGAVEHVVPWARDTLMAQLRQNYLRTRQKSLRS